MKIKFAMAVGVSLVMTCHLAAQTLGGTRDTRSEPCLWNLSSGSIDTVEHAPSLDILVRGSNLIVIGKIVKVLPPGLRAADHLHSTQTDSLVLVMERLYGTAPNNLNTITLSEFGGVLNGCGSVISDAPIVKVDEQYVLFLRTNKEKTPPNLSGSPRYDPVAIWAGKAQIVNGKIHFVPAAAAGL